MPVNGGGNTSVAFSEIQTAFGGSNPISLSEYYRGGEVNTVRTILAAGSGSGSGDGSAASISVDVQNSNTTTTSVGALSTQFGQAGTRGNYNTSNLSFLRLRASGMGNHTVVFNGTQIFSYQQDDNPGFEYNLRGPRYQSGDGGISSSGTSVGRGSLTWSGFRQGTTAGVNYSVIGTRTSSTTTVQRRRFVFTNNTGQTISLTATGNGSTTTSSVSSGGTLTIGPVNGSGQGWSVSYPAITMNDANSNIPASGTIELSDFRSITNYTPG